MVSLDARLRQNVFVGHERIEQYIASCPHPMLRQAMMEMFAQMLQGAGGASFQILRGA